MSDYMGKVSAEAFENLARASIAQDETIKQLRAELAVVKQERDALRAEVERLRDEVSILRGDNL